MSREQVEVQLLPSPDGQETFVLCRSARRRDKEQAMRRLVQQRLERALRIADISALRHRPPPSRPPAP